MVERDYHHRQVKRPVDRRLVVVVLVEDFVTVPIADAGRGQDQSGHDLDFRHWLSIGDFGKDHPGPWEGLFRN